jgi:hypothetical protein
MRIFDRLWQVGAALGVAALLALLMTGCALTPSMMSAEQFAALAKLKDAGTVCFSASTPYGKGVMSWTLIDRSIAATVSLKEDCSVTVTTQGAPLKP